MIIIFKQPENSNKTSVSRKINGVFDRLSRVSLDNFRFALKKNPYTGASLVSRFFHVISSYGTTNYGHLVVLLIDDQINIKLTLS